MPSRLTSHARPIALVALATGWLALPLQTSDYQLTVLSYAGIAAIAAVGLNLLTGYTGQVSLGHAFFLAVGAYSTAFLVRHGVPIVIWLPASAVIGAVIGVLVSPIALRLGGHYLAMVTLGLVFVGQYVFHNWVSLTGGNNGTSVIGAVPAFDRPTFRLLGTAYTRAQGLFWLIWAVVALTAWLAANLVRSRAGRAMQAVRDHDLAAEVLGVSLARYKIGAFAVASAFASVAGALYAVLQVSIQATDFDLTLSIQYIAIVIIGGIGTTYGPLLGALLLGSLPQIIQRLTEGHDLHFVRVAALNNIIYGLLIIACLMAEPRGLAAVSQRLRARYRPPGRTPTHEEARP